METLALAHGLPNRSIVNRTTPRGALVATPLEAVRDELRKRRELQAPEDLTRSLSQAHITFGNGRDRRASLRFLDGGPEYVLTHTALTAIGREILPPRAMGFLMDQAHVSEGGRKLSDMSFALWNQRAADTTFRTFRTYTTKDGSRGTVRAIRSVHSAGYAVYDNLELVEDLLSTGYAEMPVAQWTESTDGLRLRFLTESPREVRVPVPMYEVWNSETGHRAVTVRRGLFRLVCVNGMHTTEVSATNRWVHRGDRERIRNGVRGVLHEGTVAAERLLAKYNEALSIAIDDAFAWFAWRVDGFSAHEVEAVRVALSDETTTPGGSLGSLVDAITLAAHEATSDEYRQEAIELEASRLLSAGLAERLRSTRRELVAVPR